MTATGSIMADTSNQSDGMRLHADSLCGSLAVREACKEDEILFIAALASGACALSLCRGIWRETPQRWGLGPKKSPKSSSRWHPTPSTGRAHLSAHT